METEHSWKRRFARRLRELRTARGWSQQDLADRCATLTMRRIGSYERESDLPRLTSAVELARALELSALDELVPDWRLQEPE